MNSISQLLMGMDVQRWPPFKYRAFNGAYERTGYARPQGADEAGLYEHALGFLDQFIEEARKRGVPVRHRLDAQSLVWQIPYQEREKRRKEMPPPGEPEELLVELDDLAEDLFLTEPANFLHNMITLLEDKKQVIFQGPPGTGKTYVARKLANHLAGSPERVTLVQLHPSYAYEDFVQGFRPTTLENGQPGFVLRDGPLLRAAERARLEQNENHFLIIDEINRGQIAKVFGELYFLLEYRGEAITLQYQQEKRFSLPKNLYIIGTMNTADRSIALVDLALRRRFYFVDFHPDEEPIKGVLHRWIEEKAPSMIWVADVVGRANAKQQLKDDRHAAIGPSYFMKDSLNDADVRRIWEHSVKPYIEERLFVDREGLNEFDLDKLKRTISGGDELTGVDGEEESSPGSSAGNDTDGASDA